MLKARLKTCEAYREAAGAPGPSSAIGRLSLVRAFAVCLLAGCAVLFAGCSSQATVDTEIISQSPLIWPNPPEPARISYLMSVSSPKDIGATKGFFRKVTELLLGASVDDMIKPYGIAVDSADRVIVADTAFKRVHIYDMKGKKYSHIDSAGKSSLISPISVAVDARDNIYVTDSMAGRVFVYNSKGKFVSSIKAGTRPTGIALDKAAGLMYIVDTGEHSVDVYDLAGKKLKSIGGWGNEAGAFNYPVDVFVDAKGDVYVVDTMNYKVQIFGRDGRLLSRFGHQGDGTGDFGRPKGVAVDRDGHIYVADSLFDTVQVFDRDGRYLLNFGRLGSGRGDFWMPGGLFIDQGNRVYVADSFNKRVQIFEYLGDPNSN